MKHNYREDRVHGDDRILTSVQYNEILQKALSLTTGGGDLTFQCRSLWRANTRWARNEIISSGDQRNDRVTIGRRIRGAHAGISISDLSPTAIKRAVEISERILQLKSEDESARLPALPPETVPVPVLWHPSTLNLDDDSREEIFSRLVSGIKEKGLFAAGYIETSAHSQARHIVGSDNILFGRHVDSQFSITVRDTNGSGSGWAGITWDNWSRVDVDRISATAVEKCIRSLNPVFIEPGRYTTILEPQAVFDLTKSLFNEDDLLRAKSENPREPTVYTLRPGYSKIGLRMFDSRLKVHTDPYHPDCYYYPYGMMGAYKKATWVEDGVLKNLSYDRLYAISKLGQDKSLYGSDSYILEGVGSGANISESDMIANTKRGLLVTRFHIDGVIDNLSKLTTGLTRDGLWLIENGRILKAVRNMRFTESPVFVLNNVIEYGVPTRVFSPGNPCLIASIKANDFSFTATASAI